MNERRWLSQGISDELRRVLASAEGDDACARARRAQLQSRMLAMGIAVAPPALAPEGPGGTSASASHATLGQASAGTSAPIAGQAATIMATGAAPAFVLGAKLWIGVAICAAGAWVGLDSAREPRSAPIAHRESTVEARRPVDAQASDARNASGQERPTRPTRPPAGLQIAAEVEPCCAGDAEREQRAKPSSSVAPPVVAAVDPRASDRHPRAAAAKHSQRAQRQSAAPTEPRPLRAAEPLPVLASPSRGDVAVPNLEAAQAAPSAPDVELALRRIDLPSVLRVPVVLTMPATDSRLRQEVTLLEAMQRELPRMPAHALELARQHARAFPEGSLAAERELLRVQALAAIGQSKQAAFVARQLGERYPASSYARRAQRLMAASREQTVAPSSNRAARARN